MQSTAQVKTQKKFLGMKSRDWIGYLFCLPLLIGLIFFYYYPMIQAFLMSFQLTDGMGTYTWIGIQNYTRLFKDATYWSAVWNTIYMAIFAVILNVAVPFIFASLINNVAWGKNFFKSLFFVPNVVSVVATSMLFKFVFYPTNQGIMNGFLANFGIEPLRWFSDPAMTRFTVCLMGLWSGLGYNIIIFLAALQNVSRELYEAADVDGVSSFKKWWYITVPSVKPIIVFLFMMQCIGSMKRFTDVFVLGSTSGNPGGKLVTAVLFIYKNAFIGSQMGYGCAAAFVLFAIILALTIFNNVVVNRRNDE